MTIVPLTVLVPLLAAALLAASRPVSSRLMADVVAAVATLATLVFCAILVKRGADHTIVYWWGAWKPRGGHVALGIDFAFGALGAGMATFTAALTIAALVFSWRFLETVDHLFHVVILVFLAAMVGFCLSGDLFNLFVFFELMSVSAYVLVGFMIDKRSPLEGSLNFAITNSVGAIVALIGIGLVYARTGALNLAQVGEQLAHGRPPDGLVVCAFALIVCGFLVKAAVVPFHFWLADAYSVAPTPICILLAGVMSELGLLGVARIYWTAFDGVLGPHAEALRWTLLAIGIVTAFVGATMAVAQHHLKRMLAFVTVTYMGLFLVGIALLSADGLGGTATYVVGDGFVKAALFVAIGIVQQRRASVDEVELHGQARDLPLAGAIFGVGALAVAGLPPFGPFLGKALVEDAALKHPGMGWVPTAMMLASALAAASLVRAGARIFLGWGKPGVEDESSDEAQGEAEPEEDQPHDSTPAIMWVPALALLGAGLAWGVIPGVTHAAMEAAAHFTDTAGYAADVLRGAHTVPAHVPPAHGPSGGSYAYGAGAVLLALAIAAVALRRPVVIDSVRPGFARLRVLHSGHVGDYIAWLTAGVAVIGITFGVALR